MRPKCLITTAVDISYTSKTSRQTVPSPPDIPTGIRFHSNARLPFRLSYDMPLEGVSLERGCGKPSGDDMVGARVGSDGVSAGLPDAGGEVVTLRVWCAIPVHDELITK